MKNYLITIGAKPAFSSADLKKVHKQGRDEILYNGPFSEMSNYPPYSTVARNLRQSGHYLATVYLDGAYTQTVSFHLIQNLDNDD